MNHRRDFLKTTGLGIVSLSVSPWLKASEGAELPWQVGYAEADITPKPGQCMMFGFGRERYAQGAHAPLLTQALAFRDRNDQTSVLITADILEFDRVMVEVMRDQIARKHNIAAERVLLAASHTHWAPAVNFCISYAIGAPNVWYMGHLEETILAQVDKALRDMSPATVEYSAIECRSVGCCRRRPVNGKITWGPYPEGSFDSHTPILRIRREKSPRQMLVVGHACHPTSSGRLEKWSPDYPGAMRDTLVEKLPDTKALFVQGCGGDAKVVHKDPDTGELVFSASALHSRRAGEKLGQAVIRHLGEAKMTPMSGPLACSLVTGQLSYGKIWDRDEIKKYAFQGSRKSYLTWTARQYLSLPFERESFRYDVQLWRFGSQVTLFGMEGEICSPWGPILRSLARSEQAMVIGYANNTNAYIPDTRIVREGGYEGFSSHRVYFQPGAFTEEINREVKSIVIRALEAVKPGPA